MPGGGTWTVQNKVRPGAYINFISVPKPVGTMGDRGVVAVGMPMTWGPLNELIYLTGDELITGGSLAKVGVTAFDTEASLPFRVVHSGCFKSILYRTDIGGKKATATISEDILDVNAKYTGTTGNRIAVVVLKDKPSTGLYTVQILIDELLNESFIIEKITDFSDIESKFVDFDVKDEDATIPQTETAGIPLSGGENGKVSKDTYANFLKLLDTETFQCVAIYDPDVDATIPPVLKDKIEIWRNKRGKRVQAVVYNYPSADNECIISVDQGFKTTTETVDTALFPVWVASQTAGAEVNKSLTAMVVEDAVEIINFIPEDEIEDALNAGKFILSYRQDGAVCVEKDINTLHNFTVNKNYAFSKNRVIRVLDQIGNDVALIFNRNYAGKVDNNDAGRNMFKTELIALFDTMQSINAIQNFEGADDITILPGEAVDAVVVDLLIWPVDSMEKLYMTVNVNA